MTIIYIQPVNVSWPNVQANKINIGSVLITLGGGASCTYSFLDANGNTVFMGGQAALTDEQYAAWGQDDAYFINCILSNLGLTQRQPNPDELPQPEGV